MKKECLTDLHLHLDGSLSVSTVRKLAAMQNMEVPSDDKTLLKYLKVDEQCRNLQDYLKCFDYALSFLQTKEAIEESVYMLLKECDDLGLSYVEIRFAPQLHMKNGLTQKEAVEAAIRGKGRSSLPSGLILCCMRGADTCKMNLETIETASEYIGKGVCAVDVAGDEAHFPLEMLSSELETAKKLHIPVTIHAGEADGPDSVWRALQFGAVRIGHGVRSVEDPELLKELAQREVVLELCPTSNLHTKIFDRIEEYPLRKLMDAGVKVTINSDNMTVSGTNAKKELELVEKAFSLSKEEVQILKGNAIDAIFAETEIKSRLKVQMGENRIL